jgi:hypothetical protein
MNSGMTKETEEPQQTASKRFNLDLSAEAYQDMEELVRMTGSGSKREVFRLALSILKMIYPAILRGEELCLIDHKANRETRIAIPR